MLRRKLFELLGAFTLLLFGAGCGSTLPAATNPDAARECLVQALQAWKDDDVATLAKASPPIFFNDPKCKANVRLVAFEVSSDHANFGQGIRFRATLTVQAGTDAPKERKANYLVDIATAAVIVPD